MQRIHSLFRTLITSLLVVYLMVINFSVVAYATEGTEDLAPASAEAVENNAVVANTRAAQTSEQAAPSESGSAIVEIQDYTIESGSIEAGENAEITVNLRNLSSTARATGVMVTISSESGKIYPSFGHDNQMYVGSISAGGTASVTIPVTVSTSFSGEYVDLTCKIDYESNGKALKNSATMMLPAASGAELYVQSVGLISKAIVNANTLLSINYSNKSTKNIEDAVLIINGNVTGDSSRIKLGTAYAQKSYMKDYHVTFTEVGRQDITISLAYTNTNGEEVTTELGSYSVDVSEQSESAKKSTHASPQVILAGRVVATLAGIIALIAVIVYIRRK